jgi:hypothetical protein
VRWARSPGRSWRPRSRTVLDRDWLLPRSRQEAVVPTPFQIRLALQFADLLWAANIAVLSQLGIRISDPLAKRLRCFFRNARRNSGRRTAALNITQSMSRKRNCWDNAPRKSFGTLKTELVHHREYPDCDTAPTSSPSALVRSLGGSEVLPDILADWGSEVRGAPRRASRSASASNNCLASVRWGITPSASAAVYFQSPEAKSAEPQNLERPVLGCCLSPSIRLDFW